MSLARSVSSLALLLPTLGVAQTPNGVTDRSAAIGGNAAQDTIPALRSVAVGQTVRIRTDEGARYEGRVAGLTGQSLQLRVEGVEPLFEIEGIDSLWVKQHSMAKGALFGAVIVEGLGVISNR